MTNNVSRQEVLDIVENLLGAGDVRSGGPVCYEELERLLMVEYGWTVKELNKQFEGMFNDILELTDRYYNLTWT
jgi:hypothetical protein